jgi:hypothetical protein
MSEKWESVVVERPRRPLSATYAIRLDMVTVKALRAEARRRGVFPTQLARIFIQQALAESGKAGSTNHD